MNAKLITFLFGLLIFTAEKSTAQVLKFGVLGGYDNVNIHATTLQPGAVGPPFRAMTSYNVNCFISYKSKGIWGFSFEPGFMQKGGSCSFQNKCRYECNYFQIPSLVDVSVLPKLYLSVGLEFAYMVNAKASYPDRTEDISSIFKDKFEVSGLIGLNYSINRNIDFG